MKSRLLVPLLLTVLLVAIGAIASACGGGNDSDGATDGNADDRSGEGDGSSSDSSGSSVPLYASDVSDFSKGVVIGSGSELEAANRALDRAIDSGQQVIVCQYGPSDPEAQTGYTSYGFWYEDVPDNIDELLLVARDSGVPKPVSNMADNAISSCPDSRDEGKAVWRAVAGGVAAPATSEVEGGDPAKRGAFTLSLENIKGSIDYNYQVTWAFYTFDIVIEAESDVGGAITETQTCLTDIDGRESYTYHGCSAKEPRDYRIGPHGRFDIHVNELGIRGTPRSFVPYDNHTIKYWGTDEGGNPIYLEISLNYWDVFGGPLSAP